MITCLIRYELDPYKFADFEAYARVWHAAIPRCGGDLVGYFRSRTRGRPPPPAP